MDKNEVTEIIRVAFIAFSACMHDLGTQKYLTVLNPCA